jgi:hypothetical protein
MNVQTDCRCMLISRRFEMFRCWNFVAWSLRSTDQKVKVSARAGELQCSTKENTANKWRTRYVGQNVENVPITHDKHYYTGWAKRRLSFENFDANKEICQSAKRCCSLESCALNTDDTNCTVFVHSVAPLRVCTQRQDQLHQHSYIVQTPTLNSYRTPCSKQATFLGHKRK